MSEHLRSRSRDSGMTLPEVLVSVMIIALLTLTITGAIVVAVRTQDSTEGRLNVARAEQNVATWLPADLSSAVDATTEPGASPCGGPVCGGEPIGGSNALMLSWPSGGDTTNVAYVYRVAGAGPLYELVRVECTGGDCTRIVVLHDLEGPPVDEWVPGVTAVPPEVINVALPLAADATSEADTDATSSARRIVVTINGGGGSAGAGGGVNRVSITAGGTSIGELDPSKPTGPSFLEARSRCGGPITVIVDDSGSIANANASRRVENAVRGFVSALAGTPTQVQIIKFSTTSSLIDGGGWNHYYDMTDLAVVEDLVGDPDDDTPADWESIIANGLRQTGGTNWEDAIYRTFYADSTALGDDGRPINLAADGNPATFLPKLVVFFTDGEPTFNRVDGGSSGGPTNVPPRPNDKWPAAQGNTFDQEGWDRSLYLLNPFLNREDVRMIGVGVGGIASSSVTAFTDQQVQTLVTGRSRGRNEYNGIVYYNGRAYEREDPNPRSYPSNDGGRNDRLGYTTSAEKALGNLMVGVHPTAPGTPYVKATYSSGSWTNFDETTNLMVTSNFDALAEGLREIAVGECGGTLTLQTKLGSVDGSIAPADVTYEAVVGDAAPQTVTTSQLNRAAAIDMTFPASATQVDTTVRPQDLAGSGYADPSWSCSLRGAPLSPSRWSLVDPGDPTLGVTVTVAANEAVSCTMVVTPA